MDAQGSYGGGVTVLVTGYLIGNDSDKRKFAQSFFLAPQENGFFVLNDAFRYVDDKQPLGMPITIIINDVETAASHPGNHLILLCVSFILFRKTGHSVRVFKN